MQEDRTEQQQSRSFFICRTHSAFVQEVWSSGQVLPPQPWIVTPLSPGHSPSTFQELFLTFVQAGNLIWKDFAPWDCQQEDKVSGCQCLSAKLGSLDLKKIVSSCSTSMQNYKYDKAMVPESRNGGSTTLNNNNSPGNCKKILLIFLDLFCLIVGESSLKFSL